MAYNKVSYRGTVLMDLTADTVTAADVLAGVTAHGADGESLTGSMVNRGAVSGTLASKDATYTIQQGYHSGSGVVAISDAEKAKLIPANIAQGVELMGVTGSHTGAVVTAEEVPNSKGTGYVITVS